MEEQQQQLQEYLTQLADVDGLLEASPNDADLLSLKSDLQELINLTKETLSAAAAPPAAPPAVQAAAPAAVPTTVAESETQATATVTASNDLSEEGATIPSAASLEEEKHDDEQQDHQKDPEEVQPPPKKKSKTSAEMKEFEIPAHLVIHENDSEKEIKRKQRAIKAHKNKWREQKKEMETTKKQKSWQSFQQKTKKKKGNKTDKSIFSTFESSDTKIGVSSARRVTEFSQRERHKHF